jgi:hypothetical protein
MGSLPASFITMPDTVQVSSFLFSEEFRAASCALDGKLLDSQVSDALAKRSVTRSR